MDTILSFILQKNENHSNNIEEVIKDIKKLTVNQLKKFNIPYDELHFGKPYADLYIDDLAISSHQNLNKGTGFTSLKMMLIQENLTNLN